MLSYIDAVQTMLNEIHRGLFLDYNISYYQILLD